MDMCVTGVNAGTMAMLKDFNSCEFIFKTASVLPRYN